MRHARRRAERGFTVIEVVVALFLLGFGLTLMANVILFGLSQAAEGKRATDAAALAQQTLELYHDRKFSSVVAGTVTTTPTVGTDAYTVTAVVTTNNPQSNMTRVRVTVTWGAGQSYADETILSALQ